MTWRSSLKLSNLETGFDVDLPVGSALGVSETLAPIDGAASMRRSVNGDLVVIENALFRKYRVEVSSSGNTRAPALGGLWPGARLRIHCVSEIRERLAADGSATLSRRPVSGSVRAVSSSGAHVPASVDGRDVSAPGAASVSYRPRLDCAVVGLSGDWDEMGASGSWSVALEEL